MGAPRFFELLKEIKSDVDRYIFDILPSSHHIPEIDLLFKMMRDYPSRSGKGLRPGLLMIFNRAFGGKDDKALNSAAALEIFQNWIVIHDDIEDGSDLRRGQPALHIKYGIPLALNAGDALSGKMWELILKNKDIIGPEKAMTVFGEFLMMFSSTTEGQHVELGWERGHKWELTDRDYFEMCRLKTAWYTCISPSWIGSYIAGAPKNLKEAFVEFGLDLGVAFQIQDDVLNLTGDCEKYGKEIGGDILEGKRTLMLIDLLNKCGKEEKKFIIQSLDRGRESKDPRIIGDLLELMKKHGSLEYAVSVSHKMAEKARQSYMKNIDMHIGPEYKNIIVDFIEFMVNREL